MIFGYARVTTTDQNPDLPFDALKQAGFDRLFVEKASGARADRPQFCKMLEQVRAGDVILIWKLDRLGRSLRHLLEVVYRLNEQKIGLKSLTDPIDTTTSQGKLIFNIFAALAEFERDLIRERTKAGLAAARARGRAPKGYLRKQSAMPLRLRLSTGNGNTRSPRSVKRIRFAGRRFTSICGTKGFRSAGMNRVKAQRLESPSPPCLKLRPKR